MSGLNALRLVTSCLTLSKHCCLGLIESAVAGNKPPLNLFRQDPVDRSKIICKLSGVTINKLEEHIWKHINGKRFLSLLDQKKEAEKEMQNRAKGECDEEKEEKKNEDDAGAEEANYEAGELSKRTKRMSLEIEPSSFASRKKKKKFEAKSLII